MGSRLGRDPLECQDLSPFKELKNKKGVQSCHKIIKFKTGNYVPGGWNARTNSYCPYS